MTRGVCCERFSGRKKSQRGSQKSRSISSGLLDVDVGQGRNVKRKAGCGMRERAKESERERGGFGGSRSKFIGRCEVLSNL